MTRCAFLAALLFSAIAVSAVAEDAFGDLIDEGQPHGEIAELKSPSDAVTGAEGTLAKSQSGADRENFGESTTDQQSLSAPKQVTSAQSVTSGPGKYLCFKAGSGTVWSETHTVGLQFTRCDAHATCDPNKPACACKTGYAGDGETCESMHKSLFCFQCTDVSHNLYSLFFPARNSSHASCSSDPHCPWFLLCSFHES